MLFLYFKGLEKMHSIYPVVNKVIINADGYVSLCSLATLFGIFSQISCSN